MSDDASRDAAKLLGRRGGLARAQRLTLEQRRAIGRKGAAVRWAKRDDSVTMTQTPSPTEPEDEA